MLGGYAVFSAVGFGFRGWLQRRRTGSSGFRGVSGPPGSASWNGGMLLVVAFLLVLLAPALELAGVVRPIGWLATSGLRMFGAVLYAAGVLTTTWAQLAMGDSWRVGVDPSERTKLVVHGPFGLVRNPIFTATLAATAGLVLILPDLLALSGLVLAVVGIEIQVRAVEEPYLIRVHGNDYRTYAAATGRFLPGIGTIRSAG